MSATFGSFLDEEEPKKEGFLCCCCQDKSSHSLVPSHIPDKGKRLSVEAAGQSMNAFFTTTFRFKTRHTCIGDHLFDGQTRRPFTQLSLLPVNLDSGGVLLFSVLWSSMGARVVAVRLPRIDNEPAVVW